MKLDLTNVSPEDLPRVQELLGKVVENVKYNTYLQTSLDRMYPWQRKAIKFTADHKVTGVICGNQMGKSEVCCAVLACHLLGIYPDWWEGKKFDRPVKIMAAGVDSNHNKNVLQDRLFGTNNKRMNADIGSGMIPRENIIMQSLVASRGDAIESAKFKHSSGGTSELIFRAYSQGRVAAQGFPADIIMIDEQPNDEFWKEALTRTKATQGHVICSFTPLEGMTSLIENLLDLPAEEEAEDDIFGPKCRTDGRWAMVRASWFDAPHIIENDPNAVEEAKREYTYDYQARVYGIPVVGSGRIYPHPFDKITYNPVNYNINETWRHLIGVDFGWTKNDPSAMVLLAYNEDTDEIFITEEWKGSTTTDREFVKRVNFIDAQVPVAWPRDGSKASDWKGGGTIADKLREMGLNMLNKPFHNPIGPDKQKNNYLDPGFQEINARFATNRLKISTDCTELLKEIEQYGYGKTVNGDSTGKPKDKSDDHLCDAMRYAVMTVIQGFGDARVTYWQENDYEDFEYNTY